MNKVYSIRFLATNVIGSSEYSIILRVALGNQQPAPENLRSDLTKNGATFVHITWDRVSTGDLATLGYSLELL